MNGDFIAGFTEGEGCFALTLRRDVRHERPGNPTYYSWKASFVIVLRADDAELLEKIKEFLKCGHISFTKDNTQVRYEVSTLEDINQKVVPFFEHYALYGKKRNVFKSWREAVKILLKYKNKRDGVVERGKKGFSSVKWDKEDIEKLLKIQKEMLPLKSKRPINKWQGMPLGRVR
jgi:hypothetical protein